MAQSQSPAQKGKPCVQSQWRCIQVDLLFSLMLAKLAQLTPHCAQKKGSVEVEHKLYVCDD